MLGRGSSFGRSDVRPETGDPEAHDRRPGAPRREAGPDPADGSIDLRGERLPRSQHPRHQPGHGDQPVGTVLLCPEQGGDPVPDPGALLRDGIGEPGGGTGRGGGFGAAAAVVRGESPSLLREQHEGDEGAFARGDGADGRGADAGERAETALHRALPGPPASDPARRSAGADAGADVRAVRDDELDLQLVPPESRPAGGRAGGGHDPALPARLLGSDRAGFGICGGPR